jgi:hypothetical protein
MRLSTEVFFTAARKRDRQPAEDYPTSFSSTKDEMRSVDVTEAPNEHLICPANSRTLPVDW